jgi:hypothetical protein
VPNIQHKRSTRAALDALAAANGLLVGQIYFITDESRLAVATSVSTYQAASKQGEGGGGGATALDGGSASSVFLPDQNINGGSA